MEICYCVKYLVGFKYSLLSQPSLTDSLPNTGARRMERVRGREEGLHRIKDWKFNN